MLGTFGIFGVLAGCSDPGDAPSPDGRPSADAAVGDDAGGGGDAAAADADLAAPDAAPPDAAPDAAPPDAAPETLPPCPTFGSATVAARTPLLEVREASGLVASRLTPGVFWLHNDSGDTARVFAVDSNSLVAARATYTFSGVTANDWEDLAIGPGPEAGAPYLYVGDHGDNGTSRDAVQVYRVKEPANPSGTGTFPTSERFELVYPDGPHDAESLLVDPRTGDVYIVVKAVSGASPVFRAAAPLSSAAPITLEQVASLTFGAGALAGDTTTTGGDISPSGAELLVRTYDTAFIWRRTASATVAEALATEPCPVPLATEGQGEAIGFAADGSAYYSTGEGSSIAISAYARQ